MCRNAVVPRPGVFKIDFLSNLEIKNCVVVHFIDSLATGVPVLENTEPSNLDVTLIPHCRITACVSVRS